MNTQFFNIQATQITEINTNAAKNIEELQTITSTEDILSEWYYKNHMTKNALSKVWTVANLINYISGRINKKAAQKTQKIQARISTISAASRTITNISISVEWKKSRMWGNYPQADVRVSFTDNTCSTYQSERISGCGYGKESTAIAQALNQCNELLHAMYAVKEVNIDTTNHELFGYGSGYGISPYFEGGIGVSCYPRIFAAIGYDWGSISHGKTFDVYAVKLTT